MEPPYSAFSTAPLRKECWHEFQQPLKRHFIKVSEPIRHESCWLCQVQFMPSLLPQKELSRAGRLSWNRQGPTPRPPSLADPEWVRPSLPLFLLPPPRHPYRAAPCPPVALGHLKPVRSELRCAVSIKYVLDLRLTMKKKKWNIPLIFIACLNDNVFGYIG